VKRLHSSTAYPTKPMMKGLVDVFGLEPARRLRDEVPYFIDPVGSPRVHIPEYPNEKLGVFLSRDPKEDYDALLTFVHESAHACHALYYPILSRTAPTAACEAVACLAEVKLAKIAPQVAFRVLGRSLFTWGDDIRRRIDEHYSQLDRVPFVALAGEVLKRG